MRRKRIIISGFPESADDTSHFAQLAAELSITDYQIRSMFRLIPKPGTNPPRLLNIAFLSEKDKFQFLSKEISDKLKALDASSPFKNVNFYHDRTYKERVEHRKLKQEMDQKNKELLDKGISDKKFIINRIKMKVEEKPVSTVIEAEEHD